MCPYHLSMLMSLRDLELSDAFNPWIRAGDLARLPAGVTRLVLDAHWTLGPASLAVGGPAALAHAELSTFMEPLADWDFSGLALGALTSLQIHSSQYKPEEVPDWLPRCAALRELRLLPGDCFRGGPAGPRADEEGPGALPPGALAGLGSLELLEVKRWGKVVLHLDGHEALRPFTAPGSTASFPAPVKRRCLGGVRAATGGSDA